MTDYAIVLITLSDNDGGGYLGVVPDLYGCISDGETQVEALKNTQDAIVEWLQAARDLGKDIPPVGHAASKAKEREQALLKTIRVLSEQYDGLDGRLDDLSKELEHLSEAIEGQEAWLRLDRIAGRRPFEDRQNSALRC